MFGLFKTACPVDVREKLWTEQKLHWLCQHFGLKTFTTAPVIEPTLEFFPDPSSGTADDIEQLFATVCKHLKCDPTAYQLATLDENMELALDAGAAFVAFHPSDAGDQERMIATFARGLARNILLEAEHLTGHEADFRLITDLLAVAKGFGIFQANAAVRSSASSDGLTSQWAISHTGFLQARVPGYAMALLSWVSDNGDSHWVNHLGSDGRVAFKNGLKFLTKSGDSQFRSDNADHSEPSRSPTTIIDDLKTASASGRLAALWNLISNPQSYDRFEAPLMDCLNDSDSIIVAATAIAFASYGPTAMPAVGPLLERSDMDSPEARVCCAVAIGKIKPELDGDFHQMRIDTMFERLLKDRTAVVVEAALDALSAYGDDATRLATHVLPFLLRLVKNCDFDRLNRVLKCLEKIVGDNRQFLTDITAETDPELKQLLFNELDVDYEQTIDESHAFADLIRMPVNFNNMSGASGFRLSAPGDVG